MRLKNRRKPAKPDLNDEAYSFHIFIYKVASWADREMEEDLKRRELNTH